MEGYLITKKCLDNLTVFMAVSDYKMYRSHIDIFLLLPLYISLQLLLICIFDKWKIDNPLNFLIVILFILVMLTIWFISIKKHRFETFLKKRQKEVDDSIFADNVKREINEIAG